MIWIIAYLATLLVTFGIREAHLLIIMSDLAEVYQKLDEDVIKHNPNVPLFNVRYVGIKHFIPFYNIYKSSKCIIDYFKDPLASLESLENQELLAEMIQVEKYEYMQNPNIFNLLVVLKRNYKRMLNAYYLQTFDDNKKVNGEVFYDYDKDGNICVLNAFDELEKLTSSELKELIKVKGMKALPPKTIAEKVSERSKIIIRSINFDLIKEKIYAMTHPGSEVCFIKPIVITVNEKETGLTQIVIRELDDHDFELLSVSGGIESLPDTEKNDAIGYIIRGYMHSKYCVEVRNIIGLDELRDKDKTKVLNNNK